MIEPNHGPRDQAERLRQLVSGAFIPPATLHGESRTRVLTVASGKGGVGKTNFVVNVGIALAQRGVKVGILDADLGLANIDIVMGIVPKFNLLHVLRGEKSIPEIVVPGPAGVKVFAGGSGVYELANVAQWHLDRFVSGLRELDGEMDICLIDTGAGIGRQVMSFVDAAEEAVVITTPEPTAVTDAYGLIKMLSLHNREAAVRIVVNLAENQAEGALIYERLRTVSARFLGVDIGYLGCIERDPTVVRSVREQTPFVIGHPQTRAAQSVQRLADTLLDRHTETRQGGLRGVFERMLRIAR